MGSSKKSAPTKNDKQLLVSKKSGSVKKMKPTKSLSQATRKGLVASKKIPVSSIGSSKANGKAQLNSKRKRQEDSSDDSEDDDDEDDDDDSEGMQLGDSDENSSDDEDNDSDDDSGNCDEEASSTKTKKSAKEEKSKKSSPKDKKTTSKKPSTESSSKKNEPLEDNSNRTLFISRLKKGITSEQLKAFVVSKGFAVVDCRKVAQAAFGFVQFGTITELDMAVSGLNGAKFGDSEISVAKSKPPGAKKVEREASTPTDKKTPTSESRKSKKNKKRLEKKTLKRDQTSLFVKNIGQSATKELVKKQFPGATKVIISKKPGGATRGFALVRFETEEAVEEALQKYQGITMDGRQLVIDRAGSFAKNKPTTKKEDQREAEKPSITVDSDDEESSDEE